jgi:hypothetical protein
MKVFSLELFKKICEESEDPFDPKAESWAIEIDGIEAIKDETGRLYHVNKKGSKWIGLEPEWLIEI